MDLLLVRFSYRLCMPPRSWNEEWLDKPYNGSVMSTYESLVVVYIVVIF